MLTVKEVIRACSALKLSCRHSDGEFRIAYRLPGNKTDEASSYYTNDAEDAVGTARAMASRRDGVD